MRYCIKTSLHHDSREYKPGDWIELHRDEAAGLLARGVIEPDSPTAPHSDATDARTGGN